MTNRIRKAVIPAAGFGTRFLPATKSLPKEMLPIVDRPVIQYVVEEAVAAGITDILLVIGRGKRAIEEHFGRSLELEQALEARGRLQALDDLRHITTCARIHFVWQHELKGLGDAVACARQHVGDEPFAVLLGDTVVDSPEPLMAQLVRAFEQYQAPVVAVEAIAREKVSGYGVIAARAIAQGVHQIVDFIEKPSVAEAPSNLIISGRYIFTAELFDDILQTAPGINGEIQLTDAMRRQVARRPMYGVEYAGHRHDVGNNLEFIKTNVAFGLGREELKDDLAAYLRGVVAGL